MNNYYADVTTWCGERLDRWPRVHSCLNDWCPKQSENCERCNKCVAILREHRLAERGVVTTAKHSEDQK